MKLTGRLSRQGAAVTPPRQPAQPGSAPLVRPTPAPSPASGQAVPLLAGLTTRFLGASRNSHRSPCPRPGWAVSGVRRQLPGPARSRCRPWRSRPWRRAAAGPCGSTGAARRRLSPVPPRSGRRGLLLLLSPPPGPGNGLPARPEERPPVGVERGAGLCCPRAASPRPFPPCPWWVVCCFSLTPITPLANAFHPPHGSGFQLLNLPQLWPAPSWPWCSPLPPPRPCGAGCLGKGDGPCGRKHRLSQV